MTMTQILVGFVGGVGVAVALDRLIRFLARQHRLRDRFVKLMLKSANVDEEDVLRELDQDPYFGREYARPKDAAPARKGGRRRKDTTVAA